jgi:hypothetical protein
MEKHGEEYTFKFRHNPNEAWTVLAPQSYGATPQYVGLITHAWEHRDHAYPNTNARTHEDRQTHLYSHSNSSCPGYGSRCSTPG